MLNRFNNLKVKDKPEYRIDYSGTTIIEAYGSGARGSWYKHKQYFSDHYKKSLDDVDIALISYLQTQYCVGKDEKFLEGWQGVGEYHNKHLHENIHEGPLGFIMPYLYDNDYGMGIIDSGWDSVNHLNVYQVDDNGDKYEVEIPKVYELFNTLSDLISFIKQEMPKVRPHYSEEGGVLLQPWDIDEAREVLKKHGWTEQELRYLRWIGHDRGFGAPIEIRQWCVDEVESKLDLTDNRTKRAWSYILDALRVANKKCTDLGFNGPNGMCGTYISRATPDINVEDYDEDDLVRMDDGRIYILHEGD